MPVKTDFAARFVTIQAMRLRPVLKNGILPVEFLFFVI